MNACHKAYHITADRVLIECDPVALTVTRLACVVLLPRPCDVSQAVYSARAGVVLPQAIIRRFRCG